MAKNLTNRVTCLELTVNGESPVYFVLRTKESLMAFLYSQAVKNWNLAGDMPSSSRSGTVRQFFGAGSGNTYNLQTVKFISDKAAFRAAHMARNTVAQARRNDTPRMAKERAVGGRRR